MPNVDITPRTDMVASWCNQLPQWSTIFSELIDNAFDAGARRVIMRFAADRISITDDGCGCGDLAAMFTAGKHTHHSTTRLGRYGIGFKHAVASAGNVVHIRSIHAGEKHQTTVTWSWLKMSGKWEIPLSAPEPTTDASGMEITITKLRNKHGLYGAQIAKLRDRISERYAPAFEQGRSVIIESAGRSTILEAPPFPVLEYTRSVELAVQGKKASLLLGILPDGVSYARAGLTVSYGFRVIEQGVRWGFGDEPTPGLVGRLHLHDGWTLSTNKESINEDEVELVKQQIAEQCSDIIAYAVQRSFSQALKEANGQITVMLGKIMEDGALKEKRRSPAKPSGKIRLTSRMRRERAKRTREGQRMDEVKGLTNGIKISLENLGNDGGLYKYYDGDIVALNLDHPYIAAHRHDIAVLIREALHALAGRLVSEEVKQGYFTANIDENVSERLSELTGVLFRYLPPLDAS